MAFLSTTSTVWGGTSKGGLTPEGGNRPGDKVKQGWMPVLVSLGLLLVVASPGCDGNGYEAGLDAFNEGDYTTALNTFRPLAEQGDAQAQFKLGMMYHQGLEVEQEHGAAIRWYRQAADQGLASAQSNLGAMYRDGLGVSQNDDEAFKWFQRAAEQGNEAAQTNLGAMYYQGHGVGQDYQEAAQWFQRAATQGNAKAQYALGGMYYEGKGLPKDYVLAHLWVSRAAMRGFPKAVTFKETLGRLMVPEQLSEAQRLEAQGFMMR